MFSLAGKDSMEKLLSGREKQDFEWLQWNASLPETALGAQQTPSAAKMNSAGPFAGPGNDIL